MKIGDFYLFKDRSVGRILEFPKSSKGFVKLRKIRACVGKYSSKKRIGKPYTYQIIMKKLNLRKKGKLIGTRDKQRKILLKQDKILNKIYYGNQT